MKLTWILVFSILITAALITRISGHGCIITKHSTDADCTGLGLTSIPRDLPLTLVNLDVSHNPIRVLRNGSFKHLIHLDTVFLEDCSLTELELQAFQGLDFLRLLSLNSNGFTSHSFFPGVFEPLQNLETITLNGFPFSYVTNELNRLVTLRNLVIQSSGTFTLGLCTLRNLNNLEVFMQKSVMNGTFQWFRNTPIMKLTVTFLDTFELFENGFLSSFPSITYLSLIGCNFQSITEFIKVLAPFNDLTIDFIGLTHVFPKFSFPVRLTSISLESIGNICVRNLDLSYDQIGFVEFGTFSFLKYKNCIESINLSNNFIVGPSLIFLTWLPLPSLQLIDLSSQVYSLSTHLSTRIINITFPESLKVINVSYFTAQNIDIEDTFLIQNNSLEVLDITGTNLAKSCRQILKGLYKLKHLNVSRLQCSSLSKDFFRNYTSLEELVFRSSHLDVGLTDEVSMDLLSGLSLLKYVDFSGNKLADLQDNVFTSQRDVLKSLTLTDNRLTGVPYNIKYLTNLSVLDLTSNAISSLGEHERLMLETHRTKVPNFRVLLKGNPFECSCQTVNFIEWIYTTKLALDDPNNYMCTDRNGVNMKMVSIYNKLSTFRETCVDRTWLIFSICASILFVLVLVTVAVGYRYRVSINYCCLVIRRRYRGYHNIEGDTTQYKYDAFVSYNFEDYKFVCNDLMDHVEREMNLKLCLHHRDFTPAVDITDNIMDAISESKWIIIVITKSFLSSTWGQFEIEMSRRHMFQRNSSNLIVIMLDDIDKVKMPRKLFRIYNQITCLEHPGRNTYLQWKDSDYDVGDDHLFWVYLQNTLLS